MNPADQQAVQDFINHCIQEAHIGRSKLSREALLVPGMTSAWIRHFLNNLCANGADYLEIGSLMGASAVAASYGNTGNFYAVDNYSQWPDFTEEPCRIIGDWNNTHHLIGRSIPDLWHQHIETHDCKVSLIEVDCMVWEPPADLQVNVFYYDGPHGILETEQALRKFIPLLKPIVLLVDDWNSEEVRQGTTQAHLPILGSYVHNTTWNGFGVFLLDREAL